MQYVMVALYMCGAPSLEYTLLFMAGRLHSYCILGHVCLCVQGMSMRIEFAIFSGR